MQIQQENMADPYSNKKGVGHADPDISQGYINSGLVNLKRAHISTSPTGASAYLERRSEAAGTVQS